MWPPDIFPDLAPWQKAALQELGYHPACPPESSVREALAAATAYLQALHPFICRRLPLAHLAAVPAFLQTPPYKRIQAYLPGAELFAATLGPQVDQKLKALSLTQMAHAVVWHAAANAYLEDQVQAVCAPGQVLFCPGYSGTPHTDILPILEALDAARHLGIHPTPAALMIPQKSVAGLLLLDYTFTCTGCLLAPQCPHLKNQSPCYRNS